MESVLPILPPIFSITAALASLLARERGLAAIAAVAQGIQLAIGIALLALTHGGALPVHAMGGWFAPVGIVFVADRLSTIFLLLAQVVFAAALAWYFVDRETESRSRVLALVFLLEAGITGGLLTGDVFDFYVFFELMGLASYALVGYRRAEANVEAALKYAALSLVGSTFLLMGVGAVYAQTGTLAFASLRDASELVSSRGLFLLAIALILVALCLKCAVMPLHFWLPDAHSIAPTAISVLLSGALVKLGAYGIVRLLGSSAPWVWEEVGAVLQVAGSLTALFAATVAVAQTDLKRLLAWSTASQMGYVVAASALGTAAGVAAATTHAVAHGLVKSTLFLGAGSAIAVTGERNWQRMGGLLRRSPLLAAALLLALFSLAGLPPLVGFAGKLAIFSALIAKEAWLALACLVVASALMVYLAARLWLGIFGGEPAGGQKAPDRRMVGLVAAMAGLLLCVGTFAGPLLGAAEAAAADLLDGTRYRAAVRGLP